MTGEGRRRLGGQQLLVVGGAIQEEVVSAWPHPNPHTSMSCCPHFWKFWHQSDSHGSLHVGCSCRTYTAQAWCRPQACWGSRFMSSLINPMGACHHSGSLDSKTNPQIFGFSMPMGSMYPIYIFTYIYHKHQLSVGVNIPVPWILCKVGPYHLWMELYSPIITLLGGSFYLVSG